MIIPHRASPSSSSFRSSFARRGIRLFSASFSAFFSVERGRRNCIGTSFVLFSLYLYLRDTEYAHAQSKYNRTQKKTTSFSSRAAWHVSCASASAPIHKATETRRVRLAAITEKSIAPRKKAESDHIARNSCPPSLSFSTTLLYRMLPPLILKRRRAGTTNFAKSYSIAAG